MSQPLDLTPRMARGATRSDPGNNAERSRWHNRRVVLNLLREHGEVGRRTLAENTGLSSAAIGNILESLRQDGLIVEIGRIRGQRGQPARQYAICPTGAYSIGVEIGRRGIACAVTDLGGASLEQKFHAIDTHDPAACLDLITREIQRIDSAVPGMQAGIGIVSPDPVGQEGLGCAEGTSLPQWAGITQGDMAQLLNAQIFLENDANAAALGESLFGSAQGLKDFVLMYFGDGVGLGLVSDGRVLAGAHYRAGEVGHVVVVPDGRPCPCGQRGCLERYVSRHALADALGISLAPGSVTALWQHGDPKLRAWVAEAASHLVIIVRTLTTILDPAAIVLGGQMPAPVLNALIAEMRAQLGTGMPKLHLGTSGIFSAATGAAALPFYRALSGRTRISDGGFL